MILGMVTGFLFSCVIVIIAERVSVVQAVCYPGIWGLITIDMAHALGGDIWTGVLMSYLGAIIGCVVLLVKLNPINEIDQSEDII